MRYICTVLSVSDIKKSRKFYENLFGLELYQDYGINISFTCGLALQQDFDWLVNIPKEAVQKKTNNIEICFEEEDTAGDSVSSGFMIRTGISSKWESQ